MEYVTTDCNNPPDLLSRFADKGQNREQLFANKMGYMFEMVSIDAADFDYYESLRLYLEPVDVPDWEVYVDQCGRSIVPELLKVLKH